MADYANLGRDILQEITKFFSFLDEIRFGAVCSNWYKVAKDRHYFPLLLFFDTNSPKFFNILEKKVYEIDIPELEGRHCVGSSHGWLIIIDYDLETTLLNPFSKAQVNLPLLPLGRYIIWPLESCDQLIYKAVISANPSKSSNYTVVAIYLAGYKIAFWRPGDLTWTVIISKFMLEDVIWYNGAIYVVGENSKVYRVEFGMNNELVEIASQDNGNLNRKTMYMVDFMGELLLIYRMIYPDGHNVANTSEFYHTKCFMLFKLDQVNNQFVELKSINDHVLFLGSNYAALIPTTDMEDKTKNNIIYFSDNNIYDNRLGGYCDSGSYNISDGSITSFPLHNVYYQAKRPIFVHFDFY